MSDPKQRLSCGVGGDGIHVGHEEGGGASSPSSLSCVENDEASSVRGHDEEEEDDEEEEGGAEEGEVDEAVDKVCMLLSRAKRPKRRSFWVWQSRSEAACIIRSCITPEVPGTTLDVNVNNIWLLY